MKPCDKAHRTLGVMESLDPKHTDKFHHLLCEAKQLAQILNMTALSCHEAWMTHRSKHLPSLTHSFPVGMLMQEQCKKIQGTPIQALLLPDTAEKFLRNIHFFL